MDKIDLRKTLKHLYQPRAGTVVEVDVPAMRFLMIDGRGDPNTSKDYADAVEALFGLSYTLKFMVKKGATGVDYAVMPMEGERATGLEAALLQHILRADHPATHCLRHVRAVL